MLDNPSFDGKRGAGNRPDGWLQCHPLSTADVQPGAWSVSQSAYEGDTYLSLVSRGDLDDQGGAEYTGTTEIDKSTTC